MWPFSVFRPSDGSNSPSKRPATPIATSTFSASITSVFFVAWSSMVTFAPPATSRTSAPDAVFSTAFVMQPSLNSIPCFWKILSASFEMSSSSTGMMRSSISTTVTLVPNAL